LESHISFSIQDELRGMQSCIFCSSRQTRKYGGETKIQTFSERRKKLNKECKTLEEPLVKERDGMIRVPVQI
jgi:hypothetical protein